MEYNKERILELEVYINEVLKAELAVLQGILDGKCKTHNEYLELKTMITHFKTLTDGFKTQVDIGNNFYIEAQVPDTSNILLNVGLGCYVELSLDEALVMIKAKIACYEKMIGKIHKDVASVNCKIKQTLLLLSQYQNIF